VTTSSLLFDLDQLSQDFTTRAVDTAGLESGIFAEFSQRLKDLREQLESRLTANGLLSNEED
jgi:predicted YcjX-like family ATPase